MTAGSSLTPERFADLMAPLGPFEQNPRLAVAVSGGADSLALTLLAAEWAQARGGMVTALTVDHGLRPESAGEAASLGERLAARGVSHHILRWQEGDPADNNLQARARAARYRLLAEWCHDTAILHLLVAHHQDDQSETMALRLARGSGVDGLAAMAPLAPRAGLQLLRPLLSVPRSELREFLTARGESWCEDPSNLSTRFDRIKWRKILAQGGISPARLAQTAEQMGRARDALQRASATLAIDAVSLHPAGFAWLDPQPLLAAPEEIGLRLLAALLRTIGGQEFPPRLTGVENLWRDLQSGLPRRRSLERCLITPQAGRILVCRESRALAPPRALTPGRWVHWDGRHALRLGQGEGLSVSALGAEGARTCRDAAEKAKIPRAILSSLPAIMDKHGILAVPPLGYSDAESGVMDAEWHFAPHYPLAGTAFHLVTAMGNTM